MHILKVYKQEGNWGSATFKTQYWSFFIDLIRHMLCDYLLQSKSRETIDDGEDRNRQMVRWQQCQRWGWSVSTRVYHTHTRSTSVLMGLFIRPSPLVPLTGWKITPQKTRLGCKTTPMKAFLLLLNQKLLLVAECRSTSVINMAKALYTLPSNFHFRF